MDDYCKQISVLYVEDEDIIREGYSKTLRRYSKELYTASNGIDGLEIYKKYSPDIVITDIRMPKKNGVEMAQEILDINPEQIIIFTTAHTESNFTLKALDMQVEGYILKPVDKKKLVSRLEYIAKNIITSRENIKNQNIIQSILNNQSNILILTNFETIEFASKSFFQLLDIKSKDHFFEKYKNFLDIFIPCEECLTASTKENFLYNYKNNPNEEKIVSILGNKGFKLYQLKIDTVSFDEDILYAVSLTDITSLQEEKIKAKHEATHDGLTGAYNRLKFDRIFEAEYQRALRYKRPFCLAILDIDYFKNINDSFGHLVGDKILKNLSDYCLENIRETDIFARWGGEEFTVLMGETDLDKAKNVCEKLRIGLENLNLPNLPKITISIGLSQMRFDEKKETFFVRADDALYEAKQSGRNKVVTCE